MVKPKQDRIPPHSSDAEEAVLSAIFLDGADTLSKCLDAKVCDESFYVPANALVWKTLCWCNKRGTPLEVPSVCEALREKKKLDDVGGMEYLLRVSSKLPTTAGVKAAIETLQRLYIQRRALQLGQETVDAAFNYEADLAVFATKIEEALRIREGLEKPKTLQEATRDTRVLVQRIQKGEDIKEERGYTYPWDEANEKLGAIKPGEFVIIAARPGRGKSSIARQLALHWQAEYGKVAYFSREMPVGQLPQLFAQTICGVSWADVLKGRAHKAEILEFLAALDVVEKSRIAIQDRDTKFSQIQARVKAMMQVEKPSAIFLDYIQIYDPEQQKGETRDTALGRMSTGLKGLAIDYNIPVIGLAQIARSVEREEREPRSSDLRECGSLEADADRIIFSHWLPTLRGTNIAQDFNDWGIKTVHAELIQTKGRSDGQARIPLDFRRNTTTFLSPT